MSSNLETNQNERILDTPITWDLLENDFQKAFNSSSKIGISRKAKLIGDGMGYVSKIILVDFDWLDNESKIPQRAVLKITLAPEKKPIRRKTGPQNFDPTELHDLELQFYKCSKDPKKLPQSLKIPDFFCGRSFGKDGLKAGYIAMGHIEGTVDRHIYQNVDQIGSREAIDQLIELAVFSINNPGSLSEWPRIGKTLFDHFLASKNLEARMSRRADKFLEFKPLMNELVKYYKELYGDYEKFTERRLNTCKTEILCQGDIWTPNILWRLDAQGNHHVQAFIDWQLVHIGSPLEDLVFLFHSALSPEDYQATIDSHLHYYFDNLRQRIKPSEKEMPWNDYIQFKTQYETAYCCMMGLLWPVSLIILEEEIARNENFMETFGSAFVEKTLFQARETNRILRIQFPDIL